jgi:hypothetical protein
MLLERKVAAPVHKTEINGHRDLLFWPPNILYLQKSAPASPIVAVARSVQLVCGLKATEFVYFVCI